MYSYTNIYISLIYIYIYIIIWLWGGFGPVVFQWFSGGLSGKLFEVARQHCLFLQGERVSMRKRSAQVLRAEKKSAYVRQFMETAADTTPDHKRMHTVQL